MNQLRIIKITVLIFTVLLVGACILLLGSLSKKTFLTEKQQPVSNLAQPQGSVIKQIEAHEDMLHILISGGGISDRIITYNPKDKQIISNLLLSEEQNER